MNKQEAKVAMLNGDKVTHMWFSSDEWVKLVEGYYVFEDGCRCTQREFWDSRTDASWNTGWEKWL